jgi:hypothetical protein
MFRQVLFLFCSATTDLTQYLWRICVGSETHAE